MLHKLDSRLEFRLRTERSARYEKSLKNTYLSESLYRLVSLLRISNPNLICKLHTVNYADEQVPKPILLRYKTITEILGPIENIQKAILTILNLKLLQVI
jgi:phenylalanyl-tRNA synthetase beta subunit